MELIYTMLFCISIFFLLFKPLFHHFSKTSNLPPGPKGLPILGSIHWLGTQPHKSLSKLAKIYGPIMTLRLGSTTTVVLTSPEMAKQLLQTHSQSFSDRPIPDAIASLPNIEVSLVWGPSADTRWRKLRGICSTQLFTSQKLNSLQHLRYQKVEQLIEHVRKLCVSGSSVNIGQVFFATTLNLIFSTMFSIDIVDPEFSRAQEFKDLVWKVVETAGKPNLSDYFPVLKRFDLQGLRKHARVSYDRMHEIFDELIAKRMKARASHSTSRNGDFLDVLLDQWEENGGSVLNRETIKPLIQGRKEICDRRKAEKTDFASCTVAVRDTLKQGEKFNSSHRLVSQNGTFTLFFFKQEYDRTWHHKDFGYYLAIHYTQFFDQSSGGNDFGHPIWLANRQDPIADESGVLIIDATGLKITRNGDSGINYNFAQVSNGDEQYVHYTPKGWRKQYARMVMNYDGALLARQLVLDSYFCAGESTKGGCERWEGPKCRSNGDKYEMKTVTATDGQNFGYGL
ncbi:Cytochrome P450 [Corchorus capsularis]|uniref:Cytochrome P450 n=1 Tax=Corchorus capsularis TaxID=210143 RepID=A0A1R3IEP6_COCAP|nr:Cytochrome P450 [Corchorus capsularis]